MKVTCGTEGRRRGNGFSGPGRQGGDLGDSNCIHRWCRPGRSRAGGQSQPARRQRNRREQLHQCPGGKATAIVARVGSTRRRDRNACESDVNGCRIPETVFYEGDVVTYDGGSYQALRDTGEPPDNETHWRCLAAPGRDAKSIRHRGTFEEDAEYMAYDVVALNGASFLALHDKPGRCPGDGWRLLAAQGKRGVVGERGPQGPAGPPGKDAVKLVRWTLDRATYTATPVLSDGSWGPPLELRALFEQFWDEVR